MLSNADTNSSLPLARLAARARTGNQRRRRQATAKQSATRLARCAVVVVVISLLLLLSLVGWVCKCISALHLQVAIRMICQQGSRSRLPVKADGRPQLQCFSLIVQVHVKLHSDCTAARKPLALALAMSPQSRDAGLARSTALTLCAFARPKRKGVAPRPRALMNHTLANEPECTAVMNAIYSRSYVTYALRWVSPWLALAGRLLHRAHFSHSLAFLLLRFFGPKPERIHETRSRRRQQDAIFVILIWVSSINKCLLLS